MAANGRFVLEKRRQAEDICRAMESRIVQDRKALQNATFESSSGLKIDQKMRVERMKVLRAENERGLVIRRQQLADLYNDEMEGWRSEVMAKVETQEDRKARIIERAYALRDAREEERKKLVTQRYNEQWRDACDEVRTLDSKALTIHMSKDRVQQIRDKMSRKQQLSNEESLIMAEWKSQLDRAQAIEEEKQDTHHRAAIEANTQIKNQISEKERKRSEEYEQDQMEATEELRAIREAMRVEAERMKRRQQDAHSRGREIYEYNQQFKILEQEESRVQREHDRILLDYALAKEREADAADNHKKQAIRQSAIQYAEYLKELSLREAEDSAFIDEVRRKEEEKVWQARDDALQQRQDARDYLARMVDDGRQEQIRSKQDQVMQEKMESDRFSSQFMANAREGVEKERADALRRRHVSMENNDKLQDQIAFRREKEEMEKQSAYLADKRMKYIERTHQQRLAEQGGALRTNFPLKSGNWAS